MSSPDGEIRYEAADAICTITISRPARRNALRVVDRQDLARALARANRDSAVRVVVLRGDAGTFCAGGDVHEMASTSTLHESLEYGETVAQLVFRQLRVMSKPTVACVEGAAAGAGMFLALGCDICVAADDAYFVASHLAVGVPPDWGAMWLLPRLVGTARAKAVLMTARRVEARTAAEWGLISEAVPASELDDCVAGYCRDLLAVPAGAALLTRRGIDTSFDMGVEAFLAFELAGISAAALSPEHRERVSDFVNRRQRLPKEVRP